jgi:WD40 repeat protein
MVVGERDGTLGVWDLARLKRAGTLGQRLPAPASAIAFSPDGSRLAVVAEGPGRDPRAVGVLDARSGQPAGPALPGLAPGGSQAVAWSPDGRLVAAGDYAGDVLTWNARTGAPGPLHVSRPGEPVLSVAFSPDGRRLAAAFDQSGVEVHDVAGGRLVATLRSADGARWVAWSPDGRLLVTGHYDGRARLWATASWRGAGTLAGHEGYVLWAGFSPDGRTLATSGTDGTAVLWDVASRRRIGSPLTVDANQWTAAGFTPDGRRLLALAVTGRGVAWPTIPAEWERHACTVAGRSLTRREWADAVPDQPYRRVCG